MTGSYCLSKSHTCHVTSSLLQRVLKCPPPAGAQARRRWRRQVPLWCCVPTIIKFGQCFTELFKK